MQGFKMLIGGQLIEAESGKTATVINPATEEEIAQIPMGGTAEVNKAVEAARKAFPAWSRKPQSERSAILLKIAEQIRANAEELAKLECLDHGTPIRKSRFMAMGAAVHFEYAAQTAKNLMSDVLPVRPGALHFFQREPIGVCALITPWNVPLVMTVAKMAAALAVGNTCVVKPPSVDSLSSLKLAEILQKMDLPPGVVNIITGPGGSVGSALATNPDVSMISFTGSSETGKDIMAKASGTVKRLTMELGGKNPFIVLDDADLDAAVAQAIFSAFNNTGMVCASPGRYYICEKLHDEFVKRFVAAAEKVNVGDPLDEATQVGPVVSAEHRDKVESYIQSGIKEGAKLVLGGKRPDRKGYFVMPTVFIEVSQDMTIAREEIFGPVVCIMKPFTSEEKVIELANDNIYGLSASVWTKNIEKAMKFARELQAGTIWVNDHLTISPEFPWGGFKESGYGKENSLVGLEEYTQLKHVAIELSGRTAKL